MGDPYTDDDPDYASTSLISAVPPPNSFSAPRLNPSGRGSRGRGRASRGSFNSRGRGSFQGNQSHGFRIDRPQNKMGHNSSQKSSYRTFDPTQPYPSSFKRDRSPSSIPPPKRPAPRPRYDTGLFRQPNDILKASKDYEKEILPENILDITTTNTKIPEYALAIDLSMLNYFHQFESQLHKREVREVRDAMTRALPLQRLGRLQFQSSEVVQLANLDSVLPIVRPKDDSSQFNYIEMGRCPGKFSEYILWRLPERDSFRLQGFCVPLKFTEDKTNSPATVDIKTFHSECRVESRLKILGQDSNSGPVSLSWEAAHDLLKDNSDLKEDVDLVLADIVSGGEATFAYQQSLISQIFLTFKILRHGGMAIFRLSGLQTEVTHHALWILRRGFTCLNFIRPASAGALSPNIYVVCENFTSDAIKSLCDILKQTLETLSTAPLVRFLDPEIVKSDVELIQFIRGVNQRLLLSRLDSVKLVLKMLERPTTSPIGPSSLNLQQYARWEWALED